MSNRVVRLAQLLELKYGLQSEGSTPVSQERILNIAKQDILDAFRNHFSEEARGALMEQKKGSVFRFFADAGEPTLISLTSKMDKLINNIDAMTPYVMLKHVNELMSILLQMKNDPVKTVRQNIRDSLRRQKEAVIKHYLTRYETSLSRTFSLLQKAASKLQILSPSANIHSETISPQKGDLTRQELLTFILKAPYFSGLDASDIIEQIVTDPNLKNKLTTVVNAFNRGLIPIDAPEIMQAAKQIKETIDQRKKTNKPLFDGEDLIEVEE